MSRTPNIAHPVTAGLAPRARAFIESHTRVQAASHVPEVCLHLADMLAPVWHDSGELVAQAGLPPPYWAFAWAGGQGLARFVLDHPQVVAGRRVLDFAAGSGLVGIAAALAGAAHVTAAEIDPIALEACALNAALNGVSVSPHLGDLTAGPLHDGPLSPPPEVLLAGDICYERETAEAISDWMQAASEAGCLVLVGDPGRYYLPRAALTPLASYQVGTSLEIEDRDVRHTTVWAFTVSLARIAPELVVPAVAKPL